MQRQVSKAAASTGPFVSKSTRFKQGSAKSVLEQPPGPGNVSASGHFVCVDVPCLRISAERASMSYSGVCRLRMHEPVTRAQ